MSSEHDINRRTFCIQACQGASCLALGALAAACGGGGSGPSNVPQLTTVNGTVAGSTVQVQIDGSSPLAAVAGAGFVLRSGVAFLVACTAQDSFSAVTTVCTHDTCTF